MKTIQEFDDETYENLVNDFSTKCGICTTLESAANVAQYITEHMYDNW